MSLIRKDSVGIYVVAGGYTSRPGGVAGYDHAYAMHDAGLLAGDHVKTHHISGSPLTKVTTNDGMVVYWHSSKRRSS
jgi:hypothetical protein